MKKLLFLSLLLAFGCDRESAIDPNSLDYFIFGVYFGECTGNCAQLFKLEGQNLYADDNVDYLISPGGLKFQTQSLPSDKVALAEALLAQLPATLLAEEEKLIGCPDCRDQGGYYIKVKEGGDTQEWFIDPDEAKYAAFCNAIWSTVEQLE